MSYFEWFVVTGLILNIPIGAGLLVYVLRRRARIDLPLSLLIVTGIVASIGYSVELLSNDPRVMIAAVRFQYVGYVVGPVGWFLLGVELHHRRLAPHHYAMLFMVPVMTLLMALTSGYHNLLWRASEVVTAGSMTVFRYEHGPFFWLHVAYSYMLQIIAAVLIVAAVTLSKRFFVAQRVRLVTALALPWLANTVYVFGISGGALDLTPLAIGASVVILVALVFRYGLGDLVPIARERVITEMHDALLVIDEELRVIDYNPSMATLLERAIEAGEPVEQCLSGHPRLLTLLRRQRENIELLYTGFGDRVHRVSSEYLEIEHNESARLILMRDISRDSKLQDALRVVIEGTAEYLGEDFFRSLARSLSMVLKIEIAMVAEIDPANPRRAETLSFWADDAFADNVSFSVGGTPAERVIASGSCLVPTNAADQFPADRTIRTLDVDAYLGAPLHDHTGATIGVLAVMSRQPFEFGDVAQSLLEIFAMRAAAEIERRRNERQIARSERNYRQILETTRDGVCVIDDGGRVGFANPRLAELLGADGQKIDGRLLLDLVSVDIDTQHRLLEYAADDFEFLMIDRSGRSRWASVAKTLIPADGADQPRMLLVFSDRTEQHRLTTVNRRIEEQLQHAQKLESLGVLAGGVAHDFNNLLTPVMGYLELVRQRTAHDVVVNEYLDKIGFASERLSDLCAQMLTYSGKGHFARRELDINAQLSGIRELARATVSRNLVLDYDLADNLPKVRADDKQLNQVAMNLLINASEAMSERQSGRITLRTSRSVLRERPGEGFHVSEDFAPGEFVCISVTDEGTGIAREDLPRLFEPFYSTKFTGRGLGLAVVYGIVRAHHGAIRVVSERGVGTTFSVYLPAMAEAPAKALAHADTDGSILVVDDEPYIRELLRRMLGVLGYDTILAEDGRAGLSAYEHDHDHISLCLLDLTMPGMNGIELMDKVRDHDHDMPVVLVSGYTRQELSNQCSDRGNVGFLQKPFTVDQLRNALDERLVH